MPTSRRRGPAAGETAAMRYHHGDLRRALLCAAEEVLEREGPAALSLRELARVIGVSHNAPYRHFADREALLAAVAADGFRRLATGLAAADAAAPPGERLQATGRAYLDFARTHRALYLLMFGPGLRKSAHAELRDAARAAFDVLRDVVASAGIPPGPRARHGAIGAWALVHGLAHLIADGQIAEDLGADGHAMLIADVLESYATGLCATAG